MPLSSSVPFVIRRSSSHARRLKLAALGSACLWVAACSVYDASLLDRSDSSQLLNEGGEGAEAPAAGGRGSAASGGSGGTGSGSSPALGSAGEGGESGEGSGGTEGSSGGVDTSGGSGGTGSAGAGSQGGSGASSSGGTGAVSGSGGTGSAAGSAGAASGSAGGTAGTSSTGGSGSSTGSGGSAGSTGGGGSPPTVVELAANRSVTYSTQETVNEAKKGNDVDLNTKWCAKDGTFPQWWRVDLGATRTLKDFTVTFEHPDRKYSYDIETSSNGSSYTRQARLSAAGKVQSGTFPTGASARYVRITVTDGLPNTYEGVTYPTWACFYEFSVKGY